MTDIIHLNQQRKPSRTMPEHWLKRLEDSTPFSDQEHLQFERDAGPYLDDWVKQIRGRGEACEAEAEALERETRVLQAAGYYDENGRPRPELQEHFFDGHQLKPEWLEKCRKLKPEN